MSDSLVNAAPRRIAEFEVGPLAFGCWRLVAMSPADARERLEIALDAGMNLVDNADVYGFDWGGRGFGEAEELLGRVLADAPALRDRMVLATKGGIRPPVPYDSSEGNLVAACEGSLSRLGVERIDLYQIHRPDLYAHPAEVAGALDRLRSDGKIAAAGVSNHTPAQVEALRAHLPFPLASNQPEFSAAHLAPMRDGTFDQCMQHGIAALAWSPLAGGHLATGEGFSHELLSALDRLARREGVDRATLCIAFVLAHPAAP
ncbi:MAG: aldo/keto reductase, partial [Myxococcales bacterium]|nr:aldo/keto reductase [Myxococcales bacterium]